MELNSFIEDLVESFSYFYEAKLAPKILINIDIFHFQTFQKDLQA